MRISNFDEDLMRSLFQVTYIFVLMFFYKAHTWGQYPFTNIHIISIYIRPQKHAVILQFFFYWENQYQVFINHFEVEVQITNI